MPYDLSVQYAMSRSILIVDDDSRIRTSLSEALADGTTDVRTAERAEDALPRKAR